MKKVYILLASIAAFSLAIVNANSAMAQQVLNPNDPIVIYNANNPPPTPAWNSITKWVITRRINNWNTDSYKSYFYKGNAFRLKFPKSYDPSNNTKKYPILIFLHGLGEKGSIYDNDLQLYHCAQKMAQVDDNGDFDAFILFPQNQTGFWGPANFGPLNDLVNYMAQNGMVDINKVYVSGLSSGGQGAWTFIQDYPKLFAGAEIISAALNGYLAHVNSEYKYIPIWLSQGGVDMNPTPAVAHSVVDSLQSVGAPITYTEYPGYGHSVWNNHYNETDAFPYYLRQNKANPVALYGKTLFCPEDTNSIHVTLQLTPGFDGYEWRKNGIVIPGANANTMLVTKMGTYDARIKRGGEWSYWSPEPIVIGVKQVTQTPDIQISGLMSRVIPAPDGNSGVVLTLPAGYATYQWNRVGSDSILSTQQTYTATQAGSYRATVSEFGGCSSNYSAPLSIAAANGPNPPDPATSLNGFAPSQTEITLQWSNNPNPAHNETGFEIYRSTTSGSGYQLIAINPADSLSFTDHDLFPNTTYYYIVRAVNSTAAAAPSTEAGIITLVDKSAPTAPRNLSVSGSSSSSISLIWNASTDNVGIAKYYIYINGVKSYITTDTTYTVHSLIHGQVYNFTAKAVDPTGNISVASNQATSAAILSGLSYKYYTYTGSWSKLPDLTTLSPVATGVVNNVNLSVAKQSTNYAIEWQGSIRIPKSGTYTFYTTSDDGSNLSISGTKVVDNDGLHGTAEASGTYAFSQPGTYPITIRFYQEGGGAAMSVAWKSSSITKQAIPDSAFKESYTPAGSVPAAPDSIKATAVSFHQINLTWNDNSNSETGFEIFRATKQNGVYQYNIIATTAANVNSFADSSLEANTTYYYKIQAINHYGTSGFSPTGLGGLNYAYYEVNNMSQLPDFASLTPAKTGTVNNITVDVRNREDNFALKFQGTISISTAGNYTFYTKSDDGSNLYIGGMDSSHLVVKNDYLQGPTERSGIISLQPGKYPIYVTFFEKGGGQFLTASYAGPGITKQLLPDSVFANPDMSATTLPLPPSPAAPDNLVASSTAPDRILLNWNDLSDNETGFDIYRSVSNNGNYQLLASTEANNGAQASYSDSALFPNTVYYYKLLAKGIGGESAYSNEDSSLTLDNVPVLQQIDDQSMRYGTTLDVEINATDADNEAITLTAANLPTFASFTDYGDGSGVLSFMPAQSDQNTYTNIKVTAQDEHGGSSIQTFKLVVNSNYPPVLVQGADLSLNAGTTLQDTLIASDQNPTDNLTWSSEGLPAFASINAISKDTAILSLAPSLNDGGSYSFLVTVEDGNGGSDNRYMNVNVNKVNLDRTIYVSFGDGTYQAPAPWNNTNKLPHAGDIFSALKDQNNQPTNVGLQIMTPWEQIGYGNATNNLGINTGNNSGVYPDNVLRSCYWTQSAIQTVKIFGLDTNSTYKYTLIFFGSRGNVTDDRTTIYTVNGASVSLNAANNSSNTTQIDNLRPDSAGTITFSLAPVQGRPYGYLNSLVIKMNYADGTAPAAPKNLSAGNASGGVALNWEDKAYNETGYEVYRSAEQDNNYTLLNASLTPADATSYTDSTATGASQYYYKVRAVNANGVSEYAGPANITTATHLPQISPVDDVSMGTGDSVTVNVNASANNLSEVITLSASNLPPFATFQDMGNGAGKVVFTPGTTNVGRYENITITANDNYGGSSSQTFAAIVVNSNYTYTYVNFNQGAAFNAGSPWNNTNASPSANRTWSNLLDVGNNPTGMSITLQEGWTGTNTVGASTGNNSGVYPDLVMQSCYYDGTGSPRHLLLTGLDDSRKYNLVFFASRGAVYDNRTTTYTTGEQSVSLNAANNTVNTVQLSGIIPENGQIQVTVNRATGSAYAYLNAMVIQSYVNDGTPVAPDHAIATAKSESTINLSWQDHSNNETKFRILRATALNGTYTAIDSVAANTTNYTNSGLQTNIRYFYQIVAVGSNGQTSYSNTVSATTFLFAAYLNFNQGDAASPAAPAPWNNTNDVPFDDAVYGPLYDASGNNTGINVVNGGGFSGVNPWGSNTGNNSGVYPDIIISKTYWLDKADTAHLLITGLDLSKQYTFTFFGSRDGSGDRTTIFAINDVNVSMQAANNTSQTVQIADVSPDENGNIKIDIYAGRYSAFGYIGALVIQAHSHYDNNGNIIYSTARRSGNNTLMMLQNTGNINADADLKAFPNPFHDQIHVSFTQQETGVPTPLTLQFYNLDGQLILEKHLGVLSNGVHNLTLDVSDKHLPPGNYLLRLNQKSVKGDYKTIKLIKVK